MTSGSKFGYQKLKPNSHANMLEKNVGMYQLINSKNTAITTEIEQYHTEHITHEHIKGFSPCGIRQQNYRTIEQKPAAPIYDTQHLSYRQTPKNYYGYYESASFILLNEVRYPKIYGTQKTKTIILVCRKAQTDQRRRQISTCSP